MPTLGPQRRNGPGRRKAAAHDDDAPWAAVRRRVLAGPVGRVGRHAPHGSLTAVTLERHRAPALWLVTAAIAAALGVAMVVGPREAAGVLVVTLAAAAIARVIGRGRRPEGVAVRAAWVDAAVLLVLAAGIAVLSLSPGVNPNQDVSRIAPSAP